MATPTALPQSGLQPVMFLQVGEGATVEGHGAWALTQGKDSLKDTNPVGGSIKTQLRDGSVSLEPNQMLYFCSARPYAELV